MGGHAGPPLQRDTTDALRLDTIRASLQPLFVLRFFTERKRPLAVGRIIAPSRRSKAPNDWGAQGRIKGGRPPLAGGRTGAVDSSSPTHKGSINQVTSSVRGSFGAVPLRPTAMIRRTSCEVLLCAPVYYAAGITAFDEWNCRADVACVGADLRVRPQNRLRSGEDGRTHRSAPTVEASTPPSGSPEEKSTELPKREKTSHFYLLMNLESKSLLVSL